VPAPHVEVAFAADDAQLSAWSAQCGTPFARSAPWRWDQDGAAIAAAPDLLQGEFLARARAVRQAAAHRFRWAVGLAVVAVVLHVVATLRAMDVAPFRFVADGTRNQWRRPPMPGAGEQPDADACRYGAGAQLR
jgi:hypothetical protein